MLSIIGDTEKLASQRVDAHAALAVARTAGCTRIATLYQDGAAKIRMPKVFGDPLEAVLINTAGGLTGGDRLRWEVEAAAGATVSVTTQACEKVYRSRAGHAEVSVSLKAASGARIAWLPQETIVYDRSAFARTLDVDLADNAEALIVEATVFGRLAMGESVKEARFHDRWRIRRGGQLVHAEDFRIGPDVGALLSRRAVADGGIAVATVLLIADNAENRLGEARTIIGEAGGASFWSVGKCGKLLARIVAGDGYDLRKRLVPLIGLLNGQAGLPKVWSL